MRVVRILLIAMSMIAMVGAELAPAHAAQAPRYKGEVWPLAAPILLRYRPCPGFTHDMTISAVMEGETVKARITVDGSVLPVAGFLEWRLNAWVTADDRDPRHDMVPITAIARTDEMGTWTRLDVEGRDPKTGMALVPGTKAYDDILSTLMSSFQQLSNEPLRQGEDFFSAMSNEDLVRRFGKGVTGDVTVDISAPVIGDTIRAGRRAVVVNFVGSMTVREGRSAVVIDLDGYAAYDVETGLSAESGMQVVTKLPDGKRLSVTVLAQTEFR